MPTAVNSPQSLDDMGVDLGLRKEAINTKLRMDVMLDDVYEQFSGEIIKDPDGAPVPNGIYLNLTADKDGSKGANSVTIPLLLNLTGSFVLGGQEMSGNEETQQLQYFTMYYEDYGYSVASKNYGRIKNEMDMYGVFEKIQPQISIFLTEMHGLRRREAALQSNDHVIQNLGGATAAHWNSNWFIAGADPTLTITGGGSIDGYGQPVFDSTRQYAQFAGETEEPFLGGDIPYGNFTETIGEVMNGAATAGAATNANCSLSYLTSLSYYARVAKKIQPLNNGMYVTVLPSSQIKIMKENESDKLGEVFIGQNREQQTKSVSYTYKIGTVDNLEIYSDDRYPTILVADAVVDDDDLINGSGTSYIGLTPSYVQPGGVDNRGLSVHDATNNKNWDIGFLYGNMALCEWEVTPVHFEYERQDYDRNQGTGAFGESGIRLVEYDVDNGWGGTEDERNNIGSIVLAFTSPSITA